MQEIIIDGYLQWPAKADDRIKVMRWVESETIEKHRHDFFEIVLMVQGTCVHIHNNENIKLIPGDVFLIVPGEDHSYALDSRICLYNCLFYPDVFGQEIEAMKRVNSLFNFMFKRSLLKLNCNRQDVLHVDPADALSLKLILDKMLIEQERRTDGFELIQKAYLMQYLCLLGRAWEKQFGKDEVFPEGKRNMLAEAVSYIESNIHEDIRIDDIASRVYLSPNYFRKVFKQSTGLSLVEYVKHVRISKAKKLLEEDNLSVSQTAEAVGMSDLNYFSRVFKSIVGQPPSEYKRRYKLY